MILLYFILIILLDAVGDGLNDSRRKTAGHLLQALSLLGLLISPFIIREDIRWAWYIIDYAFLRIALFDMIYNLTRGLPIGYIGTTSIWDKFMQWISPGYFQWIARVLFLLTAVAICVNELM